MKRKNDLKSDLKSVDLKVLDKVLGGVQSWDGTDRKGAVIPQPPFGSHFHS